MITDFERASLLDNGIKAHHRSLYYLLLHILHVRKGGNSFELTVDRGMQGAKIGNHRTYRATLRDLEQAGYIRYTAGKNLWQPSVVEILFKAETESRLTAYRQAAAPAPEPVSEQTQPNGYSFEAFWKDYRQKGNKQSALRQWDKLSPADRMMVEAHAPRYAASREKQYQKDGERYLSLRVFEDELVGDTPQPRNFKMVR
jgi:hypothetical protein